MSGVPLVQWPPPEQEDPDWPPREHAYDSDTEQVTEHAEAAPARTGVTSEPSEAMQCLQRVLDECTDDQARMLRAHGCDLMPKRWNGKQPLIADAERA